MDNDLVAQAERAKYEQVWRHPPYRVKCHGLDMWESQREFFPDSPATAVDLGCGLGRLFARWNDEGIDAWGVDFCAASLADDVREAWSHRFVISCLWDERLPAKLHRHRFDLAVCADVMEHIPEQMVPAVLANIAAVADVAVLKIANFPHRCLGLDLHVTQRPAEWWQAQMAVQGGLPERLPLETDRDEYLYRWSPHS